MWIVNATNNGVPVVDCPIAYYIIEDACFVASVLRLQGFRITMKYIGGYKYAI